MPWLVLSDSGFRGSLPNAIRLGDYNNDGYPDMLIVSSMSSGRDAGQVTLLESRTCDVPSCSPAEVMARRRAFRQVTMGASALNQIQDAKSAMFMDIDEDVGYLLPCRSDSNH